jgi:hypothetical protein
MTSELESKQPPQYGNSPASTPTIVGSNSAPFHNKISLPGSFSLRPIFACLSNIEGDHLKHIFIKSLTSSDYSIGSCPIPDIFCTVETWETLLQKPTCLDSQKWFIAHKQHPSSSDSNVRGNGGVAIRVGPRLKIFTSELKLPKELNSPHIIWIIIDTGKEQHFVATVYLPCYNASEENGLEFSKALQTLTRTIIHIKEQYGHNSAFLILGDFNTRLGPITRDHGSHPARAPEFLDMLAKTGLHLTPSSQSNPYTFIAPEKKGCTQAQSVIDLILCSHPTSHLPASLNHTPGHCKVHHDIDMKSTHRMVSCSWAPPGLKNGSKKHTDWGEKSPSLHTFKNIETVRRYQQLLEHTKSNKPGSLSRRTQTLRSALDNKGSSVTKKMFQEKLNTLTSDYITQILNLSDQAHHNPLPKPNNSVPNSLTQLKSEHKWHQKYKPSSKSPNQQSLDKTLKERASVLQRFHDPLVPIKSKGSIKLKLKELNTRLARLTNTINDINLRKAISNFTDKALQTDLRGFYKNLNKILHNHSPLAFPSEILKPDLTTITVKESILKHCTSHFQNVSESKDDDGLEARRALTLEDIKLQQKTLNKSRVKVDTHLSNIHNFNNIASSNPFTMKELTAAIKTKKLRKATGPRPLANEHLIHGGEQIKELLLPLLNIFYESGFTPTEIQHSHLKLLHKKKSPLFIKNYRPVTLASSLLKLYETMLFARAADILRKNGVPNTLQHAGRVGKGAIDAIAQLLEILKTQPSLLMISIDLSKAFDRVNRTNLWAKLLEYGIKGRLWRAIRSTYSHSTTQITIGAALSELFSPTNGIKQGSVLSTILFIVFVEDLLRQLNILKCGPKDSEGNSKPASMFVDDLIQMPLSKAEAIKMLSVTNKYFTAQQCVINHTKTEACHHNMPEVLTTLTKEGHITPSKNVNNKITTLGISLCSPFVKEGWIPHITSRCKLATMSFALMRTKGLCMGPYFIPANMIVYNTVIVPLLSYGLQLVDLTTTAAKIINQTQARILRQILGLPGRSRTRWVLWESSTLSAHNLVNLTKVKAWHKYIKELNHKPVPKDANTILRPYFQRQVTQILISWGYASPIINSWSLDSTLLPGKRKWKLMCNLKAMEAESSDFIKWDGLQQFPYLLIKQSFKQRTPTLTLESKIPPENFALWLKARANSLGLDGDATSNKPVSDCSMCTCLGHPDHLTWLHTTFMACTIHRPIRNLLSSAVINDTNPYTQIKLTEISSQTELFAFVLSRIHRSEAINKATMDLLLCIVPKPTA